MNTQWKSEGLYEHPAKHRRGEYGNVVLSDAGVYGLMVGNTWLSCPPGWAARIHAEETGGTIGLSVISIRDIPDELHAQFKEAAARNRQTLIEAHIEAMQLYIKD